jgi:hypothetical protein
MKHILLALVATSLLTHQAKAIMPVKSNTPVTVNVDENEKKLQAARAQLEKDRSELDRTTTQLLDTQENLAKTDRSTAKSIKDSFYSLLGKTQTEPPTAAEKKILEKKEAIQKLTKEIEESEAKIDKQHAEYKRKAANLQFQAETQKLQVFDKEESFKELKKNVEEINKTAEHAIKTAVLDSRFSDLKFKYAKIGQTLDVLESRVDQTLMGIYFQDKIGALLNSKVFCEAVNQECLSPKDKKHVIQIDSLKEIFPNITDQNSRSCAEQRSRTFDKATSANELSNISTFLPLHLKT